MKVFFFCWWNFVRVFFFFPVVLVYAVLSITYYEGKSWKFFPQNKRTCFPSPTCFEVSNGLEGEAGAMSEVTPEMFTARPTRCEGGFPGPRARGTKPRACADIGAQWMDGQWVGRESCK